MGVLFAFFLGVELAFWSVAVAQLTGHREGRLAPCDQRSDRCHPDRDPIERSRGESWIPASIETTFHLLAVCAIPLALLLSGALIGDHIDKESLRHGGRAIVASAAVRIGLLPALILIFTSLAPLDLALKSVLVIQAAMPAAIFPIVVTRAHHGDMPTALQVVLGTSPIGLITIPLWIGFGLSWILPAR